jgi:arsenate reductase-like glutaredoxin family protein
VNQTVTRHLLWSVDGTRSEGCATLAAMPATTVQIFGLEKDQATRAAQRFFKERRVSISFVDLRKRSIAPAELRRFVDRLGARALLDESSTAYRDAGLGYLRMGDDEIVERLLGDVRLLRLPLVRHGNDVTVGRAEATWRDWLTRPTVG